MLISTITRAAKLALAIGLLLALCSLHAQTTTVTIPTTVSLANVDRPGVVLGVLTYFGPGQLLKNLDYANMSSFPQTYNQTSWYCSSGGTTNDTTHWYNNFSNAGGFPANYFYNAPYEAVSTTGTILGTGTIVASTSNVSAGTTFTLSNALTRACASGGNPTNEDLLIVFARNPTTQPPNLLYSISGTSAWSSDVSPNSKQVQSLSLAGGTISSNIDAVATNQTNTTSGSTQVPWLNINGTGYKEQHRAKCLTSGCTLQYSVGRIGGTTFVSGTDSPTYNTTAGAGWTDYTHTFNGSETGAQTQEVLYTLTCTGTCLIQDKGVIEPSVLNGNTTPFRDAIVRALQNLNPGSIRFMNAQEWCTSIPDQIANDGVRRVCSVAQYPGLNTNQNPQTFIPTTGYDDDLQLAYLIGAEPWISIGSFNQASDMQVLANWLGNTQCSICTSGQTWNSIFAAKGLKIHVELGNEAWNAAASNSIEPGNGSAYGLVAGANTTAYKAASGYSAATDTLIWDNWAASTQTQHYGWVDSVMQGAGCTSYTATPTKCPEMVDWAPYMLDELNTLNNLPQDEFAENTNTDSTSVTTGQQNMKLAQSYAHSTYGVNGSVYEVSYGIPGGGSSTPTQLQMNQISGSIGMGLATYEHMLLMRRDALIPGPINEFVFAGYICDSALNGTCSMAWDSQRYMAAGPGQLSTWADLPNPVAAVEQVGNQALGANNNQLATTQTGPTFSYAAGQGGTIPANSAVPDVNCFAYAGTPVSKNYTAICFNRTATSQPIAFTGAGAPLSSTPVVKTLIASAGGAATENNGQAWIGTHGTGVQPSTATAVVQPSTPNAATTGLNADTLPAYSMATYQYTLTNGAAAAPVFSVASENFNGTPFSTAITCATTGCSIEWGYASTKAGCTPNNTYSTAIYVAASEYLCAYSTAAGYTQSATTYAAYTNGTTPLPPVMSVASGTYTGVQNITLTNDTILPSGTTANPVVRLATYYTLDGTTPDATSTEYTGGTITVSTTSTLNAIAEIIGTEQINASKAVTNWKRPDCAGAGTATCTADGPGGSGLPTANSDPTGAAGTGAGQNGLLSSGCYSNSGAGPCLSIYQTPQSGVQTNVLWAKSSAVGRCDHCSHMKGDHYIKYGNNANLASAHENDNYIWDLTDTLNIQGSSQFCLYGCPGGHSDLDIGGNASVSWTATGLHPALGNGVFHHVQHEEWWNPAEVSNPLCTAIGGTAYPCVHWQTWKTDGVGTTGNLQAAGMCGQSAGCTFAAEPLGFSVGYATDQFQIDADTSSPASIQDIIDSNNFTALYDPSTQSSASYTITGVVQVPAPTFSPGAGTYTSTQTVTVSDSNTSASIYCTNNGTTPTTASPLYTGPINVAVTQTLSCIASATGYSNSSVTTAAYTINLPVAAAPTFTPPAGMYGTQVNVTLSTTTGGSTIYYTLDGSTPTTSSAVYSAPLLISSTTTLKAIAANPNYQNSAITTGSFIITSTITCFGGAVSNSGLFTVTCGFH